MGKKRKEDAQWLSMIDTSPTVWRCLILAECYKRAYRDNYSLEAVARYLMTTKRGQRIMLEELSVEYSSGPYMLAGIRMHTDVPIVKREDNYDDYFAWYLGYLYKTWIDKKNMTPSEVYAIAPVEIVWKHWPRLSTQGIYYGIEFLSSIYGESQGK